ncbi:MAG: SGNH/GDSL hydrolase family protein [Candidatus Omnitrophica bacterium]|nr:SGNH/GDSL hydrolase family protein [Candidatus Omnitrophota bacterium]
MGKITRVLIVLICCLLTISLIGCVKHSKKNHTPAFMGRQVASPQIAYVGDSLTLGYGGNHPYDYYIKLPGWNGQTITSLTIAVAGFQISDMYHSSDDKLNSIYNYDSGLNIVVIWGGTNDLWYGVTPAQAYSYLREFCQRQRRLGWKVLVMTMVSRINIDSQKNQYNVLIRNNWTKFADGIIDIARDINIGADGAYSNKVYFNADGIHLTDAGYAIIGSIAQTTITDFVMKQ